MVKTVFEEFCYLPGLLTLVRTYEYDFISDVIGRDQVWWEIDCIELKKVVNFSFVYMYMEIRLKNKSQFYCVFSKFYRNEQLHTILDSCEEQTYLSRGGVKGSHFVKRTQDYLKADICQCGEAM